MYLLILSLDIVMRVALWLFDPKRPFSISMSGLCKCGCRRVFLHRLIEDGNQICSFEVLRADTILISEASFFATRALKILNGFQIQKS